MFFYLIELAVIGYLLVDGNPTPTSGLVFRTVTLQARSDPLVSKPLTAEGRSPPFSAVYWLGSDSFPCFLVCLGNPVTRAILSFTNATRPNPRNLDLAAGNKSAICLTNFFVCSYSDPINREWMPGKVSMPLAFWLKRENGVNSLTQSSYPAKVLLINSLWGFATIHEVAGSIGPW
jgi:hypothetical protein